MNNSPSDSKKKKFKYKPKESLIDQLSNPALEYYD